MRVIRNSFLSESVRPSLCIGLSPWAKAPELRHSKPDRLYSHQSGQLRVGMALTIQSAGGGTSHFTGDFVSTHGKYGAGVGGLSMQFKQGVPCNDRGLMLVKLPSAAMTFI